VRYGPLTTVAGDGRVLAGLDNSFMSAKVGEKSSVEIPPSEGAGERKPNLIEIHSIRELQKQKIDPEVGLRVRIKDKMGTIVAVTSGRVRIDFNDPLAGKTIKYEYKVMKTAETPEQKVLGLIDADYGRSEEFEVHIEADVLEIYLPDICKYDQAWFTLKYKLVSDLREILVYKVIRFVEEYVKKEEDETPGEEADDTTDEVPTTEGEGIPSDGDTVPTEEEPSETPDTNPPQEPTGDTTTQTDGSDKASLTDES
jgi:FKBP-type peptidyl-prolyl cis-trans isomerase 2